MTHVSVLGRPSYQRLEFAGDAIMDLLITLHMSGHDGGGCVVLL